MTVKEWYETNDFVLREDFNESPILWIEENDGKLTVVDCNTSAKELGYRDESD